MKQNDDALQYASEELKRDTHFIVEAVMQNGYALEYASEEMKRDRGVALQASMALMRFGNAMRSQPFRGADGFDAFRLASEKLRPVACALFRFVAAQAQQGSRH